MHIWGYNDKFFLKVNDLKIRDLPGKNEFRKDVSLLWIKPFQNMALKRMVSRLLVIVFLKLMKIY